MKKYQRQRICSCCGQYFYDWKNQDNEGANCQTCTFGILRKEAKEYHRAINLMAENLNEKNKEKLLSFPFYKQRIIINQAIEDDVITFKIR